MATDFIKSLADKTGESVEHIENIWKNAKKELMKDKKTSDPSFFPSLVNIVKKEIGIEEDFLDRFKNWIKGEH